jgi:hypothetical protein
MNYGAMVIWIHWEELGEDLCNEGVFSFDVAK